MTETIQCRVYRCKKQPEMYLYLREGLDPESEDIPEALRARTGRLEEVMQLELHPGRTLARAKVELVIGALQSQGWFLQMPPPEILNAPLYWGD